MSTTRYVTPGHERSLTDSMPSFFPFAQNQPKVVLSEKENGVEISADLQGFEAEQIELSHTKGQLYIQASSTQTTDKKVLQPKFYELVSIEGNLDWKRAEAIFEQGQLVVFVPRDETKSDLKESIPITVKRGDR